MDIYKKQIQNLCLAQSTILVSNVKILALNVPILASDSAVSIEQTLGVPLLLQLVKPVVRGAEEALLPVGLIGITLAHVRAGLRAGSPPLVHDVVAQVVRLSGTNRGGSILFPGNASHG